MTSALLHEIGEALFGPRWYTSLAAALAVNERTVRRWAIGDGPIPDGIKADLRQLLEQRRGALSALLRRL